MIRRNLWRGYKHKETFSQGLARRFPRWMTANMMTTLRVLLAFPLAWLLLRESYGWALIIFLVAFILDFLDGPVARVQGRVSAFGKLYDPFADKVVFITAFWIAGRLQLPSNLIWTVIALEIALVVMAISVKYAMQRMKVERPLGANIFGKIKMFVQVIGVILLLVNMQSAAGQAVLETIFWVAAGLAGLSIIGHLTFRPGRDPSQSE